MIEVAGIFQFRQPKYLLKELKHRWEKEVTKEVSIKMEVIAVTAKWKRTFVLKTQLPAYSRKKHQTQRRKSRNFIKDTPESSFAVGFKRISRLQLTVSFRENM